MATAGFGTHPQFLAFSTSASRRPQLPEPAWTGAYWLVALLPGTFFGITNFVQNVAIAGGIAGPLPFLGLLALFLVTYNLFALILRGAWEVPALIDSEHTFDRTAAFLHSLIALGAGSIQLFCIAVLTAVTRDYTAFTASLPDYLSEIAISCSPVWLFAYVLSSVVLARLSRQRRAAANVASPAKLELRADGQARYVDVDHIALVEAQGNYVRVVTAERSLMSRTSLSAIEAALPRGTFIRTHRSAIVRKALISEIRRSDSGAYAAVLRDGHVAPLSRRRLSAVRNALAGRGPVETSVTTS
jgi:DNA-binding LytR/AlgR family response regulator